MALLVTAATCSGLKPKAVVSLAFTRKGKTAYTTCVSAHRENSTTFVFHDQCLVLDVDDDDTSERNPRITVAVDDHATPTKIKRLVTFEIPLAKAVEQAVASSVLAARASCCCG